MTRRQFERKLRLWQKRLGLESWDIKLDFESPAAENADASTWRFDSYDRATVKLDSDWTDWDPDFAERIIVHELLHLLTRDVDQVFKSLDGQLHRDVFSTTERRYDHETEGMIDRLSYRLVELAGS